MSKSRTVLETAATVLLTAAAVAVASFYVYGQIAGGPGSGRQVVEDSEIENWQDDTALGIRVGPADARMVVTEFMDFTCPFCAMVSPVVDSLLSRYPTEVALVFQHFPLNGRSCHCPAPWRPNAPSGRTGSGRCTNSSLRNRTRSGPGIG